MSAVLILSSGHQTWLDRTDVESIVQRSTSVKRTHRGIMQDQYETITQVRDEHGNVLDEGPLTIVAGHYGASWDMLEAARKTRKRKA